MRRTLRYIHNIKHNIKRPIVIFTAVLFLLAFSALVMAILSETENPTRRFLS